MKRNNPLRCLAAVLTAWLTGCSLNPYEGEFMCEKNRDFGKCVSVDDAYNAAVRGNDNVEIIKLDKNGNLIRPPSERSQYKAAEYRELKSLVELPITPVVAPPKVLRTLIVGYSTESSLFSPRYIHYFASEPRFVIGIEQSQKDERKTLYPNGR